MIESIVVLCGNKDDRQQWIELLTQEQSSNIVRSPTMSHVSYTKHPFTRLSKYYARLVRKKIISPELMKKLLYLQYIYKPDLSTVKMRKCTVTYTIYPAHSGNSETSTESVSIKEDENATAEKTRSLLKSTLILDVRYAVGCEDLRNLGTETQHVPLGSSSSLGVIDAKDSHRPPTFDTCKSLPCNVQSSTSNLYKFPATNVIVPTMPFCADERDSSDGDPNFEHWTSAVESWDLSPTRRAFEIPSLESLHLTNSSSQLATIEENIFDSEKLGCSGSSGATGRLHPTNASLHSSDSGMADSYRLNSSELNSYYKYYPHSRGRGTHRPQTSGSESDEHNFEHQCICSSPFGSTPRDSDRSIRSTESANSSFVAYCDTSGDKLNNDSRRVDADEENGADADEIVDGAAKVNIPSRLVFDHANRKRHTQPIPCAHRDLLKRVGRHEIRANQLSHSRRIGEHHQRPEKMYTSGLYAHWWLSKKIPGISGITEQGKLLPWHGCFPFISRFSYFLSVSLFIFIF